MSKRPPPCSNALRMAPRMPSRLAMFMGTANALPPRSLMVSTTGATSSSLMSFTQTMAPRAAICRAVSRPLPAPGPGASPDGAPRRGDQFFLEVVHADDGAAGGHLQCRFAADAGARAGDEGHAA